MKLFYPESRIHIKGADVYSHVSMVNLSVQFVVRYPNSKHNFPDVAQPLFRANCNLINQSNEDCFSLPNFPEKHKLSHSR